MEILFDTREQAAEFIAKVDSAINEIKDGGRIPATLVLERHIRRALNRALKLTTETVTVPLKPIEFGRHVDSYRDIPIVVGDSGVGSCVMGLGQDSNHTRVWIDVQREWS